MLDKNGGGGNDSKISSSIRSTIMRPGVCWKTGRRISNISSNSSSIKRYDRAPQATSVGKRVRISETAVSEVLRAKHGQKWTESVIPQDATIKEAIVVCIERGLAGMMVVDSNKKVVGMITSRDLLRILAAGFSRGDENAQNIIDSVVKDHMLPVNRVIFARPHENIALCRTLMAKLGIQCLPVLRNGSNGGEDQDSSVVEGIITSRDLAEFGLDKGRDMGGKKNYLEDVSQRVGLSSQITSMAEPPGFLKAYLTGLEKPLFVNLGIAELPNPFKGASLGDAADSYTNDASLSEDAHFYASVQVPIVSQERGDRNNKDTQTVQSVELKELTYMGVADGVGSWREYGVDPRQFSSNFMQQCHAIVLESTAEGSGGILSPSEIMAQAYSRMTEQHPSVVGSCTACIGMFDCIRHQLHYANLGDSGIMLLRHLDQTVAGTLKRAAPGQKTEALHNIKVQYVSQQQLVSFNHPYQLGWTGQDAVPAETTSLKQPSDSYSSSLHVRRGDIIIMATDGLFDNVDVDDICKIAVQWEMKHNFLLGGLEERAQRWSKGESKAALSALVVKDLAHNLCQAARANSLRTDVDSPFAILAKENDILWSGGMPDDCTVIAMHVVGRPSHDNDTESV